MMRSIPSELHSFSQGGPFRVCSVCHGTLAGERPYEIQKVYRGTEVVFEMAMCNPCGEQILRQFSRESVEALKDFLRSRFKRFPGTFRCHFCSLPKALQPGYTIIGACKGSALLRPVIVLCDGCGGKLQSELSQKTRETQEGLIRDRFPGVPAQLDLNPTLGGCPA